MSIAFRVLQPCKNCRNEPNRMCVLVKHDCFNEVADWALISAKAQDKLPHAELVLDCKSYDPCPIKTEPYRERGA